jgi:predicted enzyme related to lactoylglutathione lyase
MSRALAFYSDTLNLTVKNRGDDWSEIDAGNLTIGLNAREGTSAHAEGGAVITFTPESDIDDEVARLTKTGVRFAGGISDHSWGRIAPFKDSEGNDLQLYSPPK